MIPRYAPLKRTWLRKKARRKRELWRTGRVMEDAAGMAVLREAAFKRADGNCELCHEEAPWWDGGGPAPHPFGELIHKVARGKGGSDILKNVEWGHHACHFKRDHPGPQWSKREIEK